MLKRLLNWTQTFLKAYSRLGLAKYALGDAKGAMEAYKKGLEVEGETKSDAMRKGYETAKKRVEEELKIPFPLPINQVKALALVNLQLVLVRVQVQVVYLT